MEHLSELDQQILADIESALPASVREFARLIGIKPTLALIHEFGGLEVRFPKDEKGIAAELFDGIRNVIGHENLLKLSDYLGAGVDVYIPRCTKAMRLVRNRAIVAECDQLLETISMRNAVQAIAKKHGLTGRAVEMIVNK